MMSLRLDRISLNVRSLAAATEFYCVALGFSAGKVRDADPAFAALLGVRAVRLVRLQRGRQVLELAECDPPGAPYPPASRSNDGWFQHCALVTEDIAAAYARLNHHRYAPISRGGPRTLPGGIIAFKFRDPDGHPLELIQFPHADPRTANGIDHSAISVADVRRSVAFYTVRLGLAETARQVNVGPEQDALDDLDAAMIDVISLAPQGGALHLELLGYRTPQGRAATCGTLSDIAASRLVFAATAPDKERGTTLSDGSRAMLLRDPDGHAVLVEAPA